MKKIGWLFLGACLILGACSDTKKVAPKEGRIAVISGEEVTKSSEKVRLDKAANIVEWTTPNGNIRNKMPAISLAKATPAWKTKRAEGRSGNDLPMVPPVIVGDKIYTLDNESFLYAWNLKDGKEIWRNEGTKAQGVGLVANKNFVIFIDENGTVKAFDTKGKELWKKEFKTAFRNAPLLTDNSIYLLSFSNDLWVLNIKNGKEKWHYKTTATQTLLQSMGRPALANGILVVPFSSGEVVGFNADTGVLLWSQDLVGQKAFDAVASLSQMSASPVIENGIVYLVGHAGKTMAVNLKTGESLWQLERGGKTTPFISGNALFFVDNKNNLLAVNKKSGKLFWEVALENNVWKGPYLIDEKLVLFTDEKSVAVDPKDGKTTTLDTRIEGSFPALVNDGIFFLGDNGRLYHWEKI